MTSPLPVRVKEFCASGVGGGQEANERMEVGKAHLSIRDYKQRFEAAEELVCAPCLCKFNT
jgi:hypothetical protein